MISDVLVSATELTLRVRTDVDIAAHRRATLNAQS